MKKEAEDIITYDINILKKQVTNNEIYEHIIASILEVYTHKLKPKDVLNQIIKDIKNLAETDYDDVTVAIESLTETINGNNGMIEYIYRDDIQDNKDLWKAEITGEIYNFIYDNS
jgi:hypothetical protein